MMRKIIQNFIKNLIRIKEGKPVKDYIYRTKNPLYLYLISLTKYHIAHKRVDLINVWIDSYFFAEDYTSKEVEIEEVLKDLEMEIKNDRALYALQLPFFNEYFIIRKYDDEEYQLALLYKVRDLFLYLNKYSSVTLKQAGSLIRDVFELLASYYKLAPKQLQLEVFEYVYTAFYKK